MISIHCTQCKQLLEMDDAFAGGVCRCQYCGTIQTVPRKRNGGSGSKSKGSSSSKALYKRGSGDSGVVEGAGAPAGATGTKGGSSPGTGLDELAQAVATSSGLTRGSLSKPPPKPRSGSGSTGTTAADENGSAAPPARPGPRRQSAKLPLMIAGGVVAVLLLGAGLHFALKSSAPPANPTGKGGTTNNQGGNGATGAPQSPTEEVKPVGPSFAGVSLPVGSVVYLIDRSQANDDVLDTVKEAVYRSARSLGPERKFQVILWHHTDEGTFAYPDNGLAPATKEQVDAAKKRLEDVVSYGTTDLKQTMVKAMQSHPDVILIMTAKGFQLEHENVAAVREVMQGAATQVHTFSLGEAESATLKQIADEHNGDYREVPYKRLLIR
jgi:hypothetical protein